MNVIKLLEIFSQDGSWFWGMSQFIVITISLLSGFPKMYRND